MDLILSFLSKTFAFDENSPLLFTQFYFWAFFAIVFAIFSLILSKRLLRNTFLFIVSLFFYYKTSGLFVLLLIFATISDFFIAKLVYRSEKELYRKLFVGLSVCINLLVLSYFKYSYFFVDLVNSLFGTAFQVYDYFAAIGNAITGSNRFSVDQIILPVGISFYTFQTISYTMDVSHAAGHRWTPPVAAPTKNVRKQRLAASCSPPFFRFFSLFEKHGGYKTGKLKLKRPEQLQVR